MPLFLAETSLDSVMLVEPCVKLRASIEMGKVVKSNRVWDFEFKGRESHVAYV